MLTADQALDHMMHQSQEDLYHMCYEAHKDFYGTKGRHMYQYSVPELVSWWVSHYEWNEADQYWDTKISFEDEEALYASKEDEYDYYRQFG